jgi:CBS domain-containing protein
MNVERKNVGDIMTPSAEYISASTSLRDAARKMRDLQCGFLPISDAAGNKFEGVITDRDIVLRGVADALDPESTPVAEIETDHVLHCFRTDSLERAAKIMNDEQVYRLVVLESEDDRRLCGVISLNDLVRHDERAIVMAVAKGIAA